MLGALTPRVSCGPGVVTREDLVSLELASYSKTKDGGESAKLLLSLLRLWFRTGLFGFFELLGIDDVLL